MQIHTSSVWFVYLYFGGWKRSVFNQNLVAEKFSCFEMTNFRALDTLPFIGKFPKYGYFKFLNRRWTLISFSIFFNSTTQINYNKKIRKHTKKLYVKDLLLGL